MIDISEKNFEQSIEETLLATLAPGGAGASAIAESDTAVPLDFASGGYRRREPDEYDRALCLIPADVLDFIYVTQPKEWDKLKKQHGLEAKERLLKRLAQEVKQRGTLAVLRKGIKTDGCKFRMAYFRPATGLNYDLQKLYEANVFTVVRQLKYSEKNENSLDLVIFLNGLPIFTAELKNPLTSQTVADAMKQYVTTRDPKEPLFAFGRCLAHFAVDPDVAYMTTHLLGGKTRFLPFNQGWGTGAGNPPLATDYATSYLWRSIWARDSILDLVQNFVQAVEVEDDKGKKTGEKRLIFPRYHQLDAVRRLVADARARGTGQRYLVQHSAGSGKSNSIAWLAHQLVTLHVADKRVFDSVIVITDRRVLDRQLQRTVRQFEQTVGLVENIDRTSKQLKTALEEGKNIIVTTLQKFPMIVKEIDSLAGSRFAVIIDEAHSSQGGESTKSLKKVLATDDLAAAEREEAEEGEDLEDRIVAEVKARGPLPNVSYFAFTATPKPATLQLFGRQTAEGKYEPFSLYAMRQAIEERFILDVLENYTTYKAYFNLHKKVKDDPKYDKRKAGYVLVSYASLHEHAINQKVAIMAEHFADHVAHQIGGKAKAMIVTRSRLHAVRYALALSKYLAEKDYPYKALVAFSDRVKDGEATYTEAGMNGVGEKQTAETFKGLDYRFLVVANKFQTGFDQPLLHTMYVDKRLTGVNAVQTLSRLNRIHPEKQGTMVLDFANEADDIQKAFQPYYERTLLKEGTDPNVLYDLQAQLADFHFYAEKDVEAFTAVYFAEKPSQAKVHGALAPVVARFSEAEEDDKARFRGHLRDYLRLYSFLSQVITYVDADLEKLFVFGRLLLRKLPLSPEKLPLEIQENVDMDSYQVKRRSSGKIQLQRGTQEVSPLKPKAPVIPPEEYMEALSQIIRELNDRFGTNLTKEDVVFIQQLEAKLANDPALQASVRINPPDHAKLTFDEKVNDRLQEMIDANFKFYKQINDDPDFSDFFKDWLFTRYRKAVRSDK
ncbi:MAG: type I restriction endonuclease subunit R [Chloroflexota bacterium]